MVVGCRPLCMELPQFSQVQLGRKGKRYARPGVGTSVGIKKRRCSVDELREAIETIIQTIIVVERESQPKKETINALAKTVACINRPV